MSHNTSLIIPLAFAASAAIFSGFGKRKANSNKGKDAKDLLEPLPTDVVETTPPAADTVSDDDGRTLPVLGVFGQGEEADQDTCGRIWNALSVPKRETEEEEPAATRFFGMTAFDPAPEVLDAVVQTAMKLAESVVARGYSVLLMDANLHRPSLHTQSPFLGENTKDTIIPRGMAEFLRGETSKLSALIKVASGNEDLLLLPSGRVTESDAVLTGSATLDRLLRLASPFAEIVIMIAPPLMSPMQSVDNSHILPRMNGVLVAYPSGFSASSDTEALEKLEAMDVAEVGAIVAPPASFADAPAVPVSEREPHAVPQIEAVTVAEMATMVDPDPIGAVEPDAKPEVVTTPEESPLPESTDAMEEVASPEIMEPETEQLSEVPEVVEPADLPESVAISLTTDTVEAGEVAVPEEAIDVPVSVPVPVPVPLVAVPPVVVESPRPSFMAGNAPASSERSRGNTRRAVPVETISADTIAPVRQNRPTMITPSVEPRFVASVAYRPEVSLELIPASEEAGQVILRAEVGGMGNNPALLLEVRTLASESKKLRADNPGTSGGIDAPILVLESLVSDDAPEDATTLRLHARESSMPDAATLLEATLETPDALRIKSGKATAVGVPPVRFEVTSEPDGTSRFRATVPPLGETPALYVDLERTTTTEGRWSRVLLRLA